MLCVNSRVIGCKGGNECVQQSTQPIPPRACSLSANMRNQGQAEPNDGERSTAGVRNGSINLPIVRSHPRLFTKSSTEEDPLLHESKHEDPASQSQPLVACPEVQPTKASLPLANEPSERVKVFVIVILGLSFCIMYSAFSMACCHSHLFFHFFIFSFCSCSR